MREKLAALTGLTGLGIASACCLPLVSTALAAIGGIGLLFALAKYKLPLTLFGLALLAASIYLYSVENRTCDKCDERGMD